MGTEYADVVVVGSGFGGSVVAYRAALAGRSVVLLERGRAYPPGSFARSPAQMYRNFWVPKQGQYGLFDVWTFDGFDSLVASGLGGGSLIYANVLLRKDESWFVTEDALPGGGHEHWPVTYRDLEPHYEAVEAMLSPVRYPVDHPAYRHSSKTHAMRQAAAHLDLDWDLVPLAVDFAGTPGGSPGLGLPIVEPSYGNLHGVPRRTCRLCGECDIGCNDGAKNSLDHTYLSAARHHGADLRTLSEVRAFAPLPGGGWELSYREHTEQPGEPVSKPRRLRCERLVLAAGTYGTTRLLLRNAARLPGLSRALGTRFSGNGDLLSLLFHAGDDERPLRIDATTGPVITSAIRLPDAADGADPGVRGAYIQDGGYPGFLDWVLESAMSPGQVRRVVEFAGRRLLGRLLGRGAANSSSAVAELLGDGALTSTSLPLLGMGRDVPDGRMRLAEDGQLRIDWTTETSMPYFDRVRTVMAEMAEALEADHQDNPTWLAKRVITAHPLGGAPMGRHDGEGVCDSHGEVFGHPGLYVADGAAMPGSVGPNPSLTIAAFADRVATRLLETPRPHPVPVPDRPSTLCSSLTFSERMTGHLAEGEPFDVRLRITIADVDAFINDHRVAARADGSVESPFLGGQRDVTDGWFTLIPGPLPDSRRMIYRLWFTDVNDEPRTLVGLKHLRDDPGPDLWSDTTTLRFKVLRGHIRTNVAGECLSRGVVRISVAELARTLSSMTPSGFSPNRTYARFGRYLLGNLWDVYGSGPDAEA